MSFMYQTLSILENIENRWKINLQCLIVYKSRARVEHNLIWIQNSNIFCQLCDHSFFLNKITTFPLLSQVCLSLLGHAQSFITKLQQWPAIISAILSCLHRPNLAQDSGMGLDKTVDTTSRFTAGAVLESGYYTIS